MTAENSNETSTDKPVAIQARIAGPIDVTFPLSMFLPSGTLAQRVHRGKFLEQMAGFYDDIYEQCRANLNERDPETERPPRAKDAIALIDASAVSRALDEATGVMDDEPEVPDGSSLIS